MFRTDRKETFIRLAFAAATLSAVAASFAIRWPARPLMPPGYVAQADGPGSCTDDRCGDPEEDSAWQEAPDVPGNMRVCTRVKGVIACTEESL